MAWNWKINSKRIIYVTFQKRDLLFGKKQYAYLLEDERNIIISPEKTIKTDRYPLLRVEKEEWVNDIPAIVTQKIYINEFGRVSIGNFRFTL